MAEEDDDFWIGPDQFGVGGGGFYSYPEGLLTMTEMKEWRKELLAQQKRRIVPGFYRGTMPRE